MKYQLVLQWSCQADLDYDRLIKIEEILLERLPQSAEVDGHDVGQEEMNIFILTDDPLDYFESVRSLLGKQLAWKNLRAAYRELSGTEYVVVWPHDLTEFSVR